MKARKKIECNFCFGSGRIFDGNCDLCKGRGYNYPKVKLTTRCAKCLRLKFKPFDDHCNKCNTAKSWCKGCNEPHKEEGIEFCDERCEHVFNIHESQKERKKKYKNRKNNKFNPID